MRRVILQMADCPDECVDITYRDRNTALARADGARELPVRISDKDRRASGSQNPIELARNDEPFELGQ